jgi:cell division transport system ATP-binding protein
MQIPVVSLRSACIKQADKVIFEQVDLEVHYGEFVYLIGKTGSGKSSLLKTLYADLPFPKGEITVAGYALQQLKSSDIPFLRRRIGIVFQDFQLFSDRNVFENLAFVLKATGWKNKLEIQKRISEVLQLFDLEALIYKMPHQLSGGEQQRIAIARALLNDPLILMADEPTGNLDPTVAADILNLFKKVNQEKGTAVLMATHNHSFLKKHPARTLYCENGEVRDLDKDLVMRKMNE